MVVSINVSKHRRIWRSHRSTTASTSAR